MAAQAKKRPGSRANHKPKDGSWQEFVNTLVRVPKASLEDAPVWRGQRLCEWECESTLQRTLRKGGIEDVEPHDWSEWQQKALSWFRAHARVYLQSPPEEEDLLSWLILMQHHGAPTRLLDWSESPFVALYFAYRDMAPNADKPAALFRLDTFDLRAVGDQDAGIGRDDFHRHAPFPSAGSTWQDRENEMIRMHAREKRSWPLPVVPSRPDAQMIAQQTVMTVVGDLSKTLEPGYPLPGGRSIQKIKLPIEWRADALATLRRMGITESSLFPTLDGLGRETQLLLREGARPARLEFESMWSERADADST